MRALMGLELSLGVSLEAAIGDEAFLQLGRFVVQLDVRLQIALHRTPIFAMRTLKNDKFNRVKRLGFYRFRCPFLPSQSLRTFSVKI